MMPLVNQNNWLKESRMPWKRSWELTSMSTLPFTPHFSLTFCCWASDIGILSLEIYHFTFNRIMASCGYVICLNVSPLAGLNSIFETEDRHQLESVVMPPRLVGKNKFRETSLSAKTKEFCFNTASSKVFPWQ